MPIPDHLRGDRIQTVPAIKACGRCGQRSIDIRRKSTFGIGGEGHLLCLPCVQLEHEPQGEAVRLFTPALGQIPGQLTL